MQIFYVKYFLFGYFYEPGVIDLGVWVEVDDLHLVAFCAPSPPQELVLVGAADDGREAVVGGILTLPGRNVDIKLQPFIIICENRILLVIDRGDEDGVGRGCGNRVNHLGILEFHLEVFDDLGVCEVQLLEFVIFCLQCRVLCHG